MGLVLILGMLGALLTSCIVSADYPNGTGDAPEPDAKGYKLHDEILLDIGRKLPEFGGMYISSKDNSILYVYVVADSEEILGIDTEEVKKAFKHVLNDDVTAGREIRLIPAQYSMTQLYEWYELMRPTVWAHPYIVMTDLNEGINRIELGVESLEGVEELRDSLEQLGIPREAVVIIQGERVRYDIGYIRVVPIEGELEINEIEAGYPISSPGKDPDAALACAQGSALERGGQEGFTITKRCPPTLADVDEDLLSQPDHIDNRDAIGATGDSPEPDAASYKTHDDILFDIGRRIPEFGGMYFSKGNSVVNVYVLEGSEHILDTEEVKEAIEDVVKAGITARREIRLIPAQYSMTQLYEWYELMRPTVWAHPGIVMTDLNEGKNRIELGVESLEGVEELRDSLEDLGIPRKAVVIVQGERARYDTHTLRDNATGGDLEGGYMISRPGTVPGVALACTLGFIVERAGQAGLITNAHCTATLGSVDGNLFYQPDHIRNRDAIGTETKDQGFKSGLPGCGSGNLCRYSDSAFIELGSEVDYNLGAIAKPTGRGQTAVDHNAKFRIVSDSWFPMMGDIVHKVGRGTGWTSGSVIQTCTAAPAIPGSFDRWFLCQTKANYGASGTDSGSPVFQITNSPNTNDVKLVGVHWGHVLGVPTYSPIGNVYLDLGPSLVWNACDSAFNC